MDKEAAIRKNPEIVSRQIGGETVLIPTDRPHGSGDFIYFLNDTASYVWNLINGSRTLSQIKEKILHKFEVKEATLEKELKELIKDLRSIKAIE